MSQQPVDWQPWQFQKPEDPMTQQNAPAKCPQCESEWKSDLRSKCEPKLGNVPHDWHRATPPEGETDDNGTTRTLLPKL